MIRSAVFASLMALGVIGAAQAADAGPRLVNSGGSQEVAYEGQPGNVVGGAYATVTGGGDNLVYQAAPGSRTTTGAGRIGRVVNVNGETQVVYAPAASPAPAVRLSSGR